MEIFRAGLAQILVSVVGLVGAYWISVAAANENVPWFFGVVIAAAIGVLIWWGGHLADSFGFGGQGGFERSIAGLWLETYEGAPGVKSYCLIDVSLEGMDARSLHLQGTVYDSDGGTFATWWSKMVYVDRNTRSLLYTYEGEFQNEQSSINTVSHGHGRMVFTAKKKNRYMSGSGYFEDEYTGRKRIRFDTDRLSDAYCRTRFDMDAPVQTEEKRELMARVTAGP